MEVITRKRSPNENKSPKRENELDDVNLSPKRKGREQTARHVIPEMRKDEDDNKHAWEDEDHKSRSSHRRFQLSSAVNKQKESSVKVNEDDYSPDAAGRRAFESRIRLDKMESRSKDQEIKNEKLLGKEKHRAPHKRDGEKSYERDNSPPISVKEREGKVEYNSQSATDSEESGKHRHEVREKKKHRRSERREAASDDDSNYESEIEGGRKDAKRRRKEEKKSRKEEKRRRREDRRRKREEKHSEKLKTKGHNDVSVLDKDSNQSNDEETESERKRLEIELRQKALESLKAKKGISN
jgi:serine/arginine repetitive matrix protein 1